MTGPEPPLPQPMPTSPLRTEQAVLLLGAGLLIGFGTVNYAYAILAEEITTEFRITEPLFYSILSMALLISGFAAPSLGRLVDRHLAVAVMAIGSIVIGALYLGMSFAPAFWSLAACMVALQVASIAVFYNSAFPAIARFSVQKAPRAITQLTLIGGLAPTVFLPFIGYLSAEIGWRATFLVFAALHLLIVLPLQLYVLRRTPSVLGIVDPSPPPISRSAGLSPRLAFWLVAVSFGVTSILSTTFMVHLIPILMLSGLGPHTFVVSMLLGPAMVLPRLALSIFWPDVSPLRIAIISVLIFLAALLCLAVPLPPFVAGIAFVLCYGCAHGLNVISTGTLPLQLFGAEGYGEVLGRLHFVRVILGAGAPAAFSFALAATNLATTAIAGMIMIGVGLAPLLVLRQLTARKSR